MTARPEAPPATAAVPPVPESLLVPLLDAAAETFARTAAPDRPGVLRPLNDFDRRGLQSGAARQQLRRAFDVDDGFRDAVVEHFLEKPEVSGALESWDPSVALRRVEDASERSDLPLLASTLYAARPTGWAFGLGALCAAFERQRAEKERDDDAKAREMQLSSADEARRRAEGARDRAESTAARLEEQLKDERRSRRERELRAEHEADDALRRRHAAEADAEKARAEAADARARLQREAERARDAEQRLRAAERSLKERQTTVAPPATMAGAAVHELAGAAEEARALATSLEGLTRRARDAVPPPASRETVSEARAAPHPMPASTGRMRAECPPGMRADSAEALDAMVRTRGVVLVVDGYNVSMAGWGNVEPAAQRERLVAALSRLHLRVRCDVVVVFDGADVVGVTPARRPGVRVVFSDSGEEADPVVVREVSELPATVPVLVASSDQWVQEHSEAEGAVVVPSAALLEVLRR